MPFDGRDFNRMVRQIKRGAYYEPDTPSSKRREPGTIQLHFF